jgi:dynein heavy chain
MLLQNCHLSLDYINEVMDTILETENIKETFRLWVTSEVHPKFSINFLQVRGHGMLGQGSWNSRRSGITKC